MQLVDVHCHLDLYPDFVEGEFDLDAFIRQQEAAGVKAIITNGVKPDSNRKVLALAKEYPIVKASLGFYPTHIQEFSAEEFAAELRFIEGHKDEIVALGEIGLDKYGGDADFAQQKDALIQLVELAKKLDKPILVHSRKAEEETIELLEQLGHKKIVMHCFTGKKKLVQRIIDNGWYLSIPCTVVKLQQFQDMVKAMPFSRILTETDGPLLSPFPEVRPNESRFVAESIRKIAELKGLDPEEAANQVFMNYQTLFL